MQRLTPQRARALVWLGFGLLYVFVGSLTPFLLLLGWWEAVPAVVLALITGDRVAQWAASRPPQATSDPSG
jgi:hypothetical protein